MNTLILDFYLTDPAIRLRGLSFKKLQGTNANSYIYRDRDDRQYRISTTHNIDGKTAKIKTDFLVQTLKEIKSRIPFDKIIIKSYYPIDANTLLVLVNQ